MNTIVSKCKIACWGLTQIVKAAPIEAFFLTALLLFQGCTTGITLFVIEGIVKWLMHAAENIATSVQLLFLIALWSITLVAEMALGPLVSLLRINLNEKVLVHCNLILMNRANSFEGLQPFENTQTYNELQFLKDEAARRPLNFVYAFTGFLKELASICSIFTVLMTISWWLPILLALSTIPHAWSMVWLEKQSWDVALFRGSEARRLAWLSSLTLDEKAAKEIRLFGFGDFLVQRYQELAKAFHNSVNPLRMSQCRRAIMLSLCTVVGSLLTFIWVIFYARSGMIDAAVIIMLLQALIFIQKGFSSLMLDAAMLLQPLYFFDKLHQFMQVTTTYLAQSIKKQANIDLKKGIIFENVSFAYPDGRKVLHNINLVIYPGEKLAIVGENGAGKTTLIKLLVRLYDPTEGRITINGVDLKDLDVHSWRQKISAVFQDFCQFQLTVKENIALAQIECLNHTYAIQKAAEAGGFAPVANKLPHRYDTLLGKEFGGTQLSGGEWQKLALSRACMKKADIFIFDEPTAALDPSSEHEMFQNFAALSKNKITIFITHRLGSVSMCDRIIVLKNGTITEEGQHQDLLHNQKEYAHLFAMQASRYQTFSALL